MLKNHGFLLLLLLLLAFASCKDCDPDPVTHSLHDQLIPYAEGSSFVMVADNGDLIRFTDTLYKSGTSGSEEPGCNCCAITYSEYVSTSFRSDSSGIGLSIRQSPAGERDEDQLSIALNVGTFSFLATSTNAIGGVTYTTQATTHSSLQIGNRSYNNVFEAWNTDTIVQYPAKRIWYNASNGLLKIAFADSTNWVIQN